MKKNNPNPKIPDSQTQKADLTACGLYIPHDKLVDILNYIITIEGLEAAIETYKRMCIFCSSVKGWHATSSRIETFLINKRVEFVSEEQKPDEENSVRNFFLNIMGNDISSFAHMGQLIMENMGIIKQFIDKNKDNDDRGNEIEGSGDSC